MGKMICFDMDGTIANLYAVEDWEKRLRNNDPTPYLEAVPMWNMTMLRERLLALSEQGWEIRVISWLSKDSSESYKQLVRQAKRIWLEKYDFPVDKCHFVAYGTTKADCVRRWANPGILVDDNEKVRNGWTLGDTINPMDGDLLEKLSQLLKKSS